ncbi:4-hydroxy-tetrahydrodipicolinate reductase [Rhodospirillaceae bacterium SYSU D60014]|uniref:4-hydroxy-tetrahydrodipicolinate reductase n=1 Tax=Virgifigura deserti TaxID=2268457 RepID=UPI000E65F916
MTIRICIAGATGWVGQSLVEAVAAAEDLALAGAVARKGAGEDVGTALGREPVGVALSASVADALAVPTDVLIDYTHPTAVKAHVLAAVERGVAAIVGTSGLTAADYDEIDRAARDRGVGVVAAGNFSLTATLLQHFALIAAAHVPEWEILDYGKSTKPDVPSGTARELAERLGQVGQPPLGVPLDKLVGPKEARGADIGGSRVHSIRLPSYVLSCEVVFGMAGERLSLRHDAGSSAEPYVAGTLLAARRAGAITGLVRGLDRLLFG